ncbi:MAG: alpha/beta hydrolase [Erysipelotrichaceae bacterium]|nr:alpha/beta hydrolase [Erysipelotrichaceae bacterium]
MKIGKLIKKVLLVICVLVLLVMVLIGGLFLFAAYKNDHYYNFSSAAGKIEKEYATLGSADTMLLEYDAEDEIIGKYRIWYPKELINTDMSYPLVIIVNGTGTPSSMIDGVMKHLASWGFIVAGNEDENSRTGASSESTLVFLMSLNEDPESVFYHRIDTEHVGITGHSQGGVGAFNAVTAQEHGSVYSAIWSISPTSPYWGQENVFGKEWAYDLSELTIPCAMVAGTGAFDSGEAEDITPTSGQGICPLWALDMNYNAISDSVPKLIGRLTDKDHGDTLRDSDGYMTAWFCYWLKGDEEAGKAFFGESPEMADNSSWQDVRICIK